MTTATIKGFELAGEYAALDDLLAESEGELTPEIEALLAELDAKAEDKIEKIALVILRYRSTARAIKEEEDRLAARRRAQTRAADGLLDYLARTMDAIGKAKVQGTLATVAFQANPPAVVVDESVLTEARLVAMYEDEHSTLVRAVPATYVLDKRAILDAVRGGGALPEGCTVVRDRSLRIR